MTQKKHDEMTIVELEQIYQLNNWARATADVAIVINKVNLSNACVVGCGDSSWGNADGNKTQTGLLVVISSE